MISSSSSSLSHSTTTSTINSFSHKNNNSTILNDALSRLSSSFPAIPPNLFKRITSRLHPSSSRHHHHSSSSSSLSTTIPLTRKNLISEYHIIAERMDLIGVNIKLGRRLNHLVNRFVSLYDSSNGDDNNVIIHGSDDDDRRQQRQRWIDSCLYLLILLRGSPVERYRLELLRGGGGEDVVLRDKGSDNEEEEEGGGSETDDLINVSNDDDDNDDDYSLGLWSCSSSSSSNSSGDSDDSRRYRQITTTTTTKNDLNDEALCHGPTTTSGNRSSSSSSSYTKNDQSGNDDDDDDDLSLSKNDSSPTPHLLIPPTHHHHHFGHEFINDGAFLHHVNVLRQRQAAAAETASSQDDNHHHQCTNNSSRTIIPSIISGSFNRTNEHKQRRKTIIVSEMELYRALINAINGWESSYFHRRYYYSSVKQQQQQQHRLTNNDTTKPQQQNYWNTTTTWGSSSRCYQPTTATLSPSATTCLISRVLSHVADPLDSLRQFSRNDDDHGVDEKQLLPSRTMRGLRRGIRFILYQLTTSRHHDDDDMSSSSLLRRGGWSMNDELVLATVRQWIWDCTVVKKQQQQQSSLSWSSSSSTNDNSNENETAIATAHCLSVLHEIFHRELRLLLPTPCDDVARLVSSYQTTIDNKKTASSSHLVTASFCLFFESLVPYIHLLERWMFSGCLDDVHGELFLQKRHEDKQQQQKGGVGQRQRRGGTYNGVIDVDGEGHNMAEEGNCNHHCYSLYDDNDDIVIRPCVCHGGDTTTTTITAAIPSFLNDIAEDILWCGIHVRALQRLRLLSLQQQQRHCRDNDPLLVNNTDVSYNDHDQYYVTNNLDTVLLSRDCDDDDHHVVVVVMTNSMSSSLGKEKPFCFNNNGGSFTFVSLLEKEKLSKMMTAIECDGNHNNHSLFKICHPPMETITSIIKSNIRHHCHTIAHTITTCLMGHPTTTTALTTHTTTTTTHHYHHYNHHLEDCRYMRGGGSYYNNNMMDYIRTLNILFFFHDADIHTALLDELIAEQRRRCRPLSSSSMTSTSMTTRRRAVARLTSLLQWGIEKRYPRDRTANNTSSLMMKSRHHHYNNVVLDILHTARVVIDDSDDDNNNNNNNADNNNSFQQQQQQQAVVKITLHEDGNNNNNNSSSSPSSSCIPYPINLIITKDIINMYSQISSFLIKLKCTLAQCQKLQRHYHELFKCQQATTRSTQQQRRRQRKCLIVIFKLHYIMTSLVEYIMEQVTLTAGVVVSSSSVSHHHHRFDDGGGGGGGGGGIKSLKSYYNKCMEDIFDKCFLSQRNDVLRGYVYNLMDVVMQLCLNEEVEKEKEEERRRRWREGMTEDEDDEEQERYCYWWERMERNIDRLVRVILLLITRDGGGKGESDDDDDDSDNKDGDHGYDGCWEGLIVRLASFSTNCF